MGWELNKTYLLDGVNDRKQSVVCGPGERGRPTCCGERERDSLPLRSDIITSALL
jgi:hypothetical protein